MTRRTPPDAGQGAALAIIGAACRLPGAPDRAAFARLLAEGRDAVTEVPPGRFTRARFFHPRPGEPARAPHFRAGTIGDVLSFDAAAFGISPREAQEMDPQQRLALALARRALEDAGWPEAATAGAPIGVFAGASTTDWADLRQHDLGGTDRYGMTGGALSILANRITHAFDWRGPAFVVDTACSSGLVALHQAAGALRRGEAPAALVLGVNLLLSPLPFGGFWRAGMLGARGRCQAFGAGADGYVRAEGGVALLLKPLDAALRDGDAVRGVLLASGVNAAGRTNGISLPDGAAQAALIRQVRESAGLDGEAIGYFEAHGTGTPVGDPIEARAISEGVGPRRQPLPIGSAKSNIGHTEAAAGLVGVLKALCVLESGRIPPTLHCAPPNPAIPFAALGLRPAATALPLEGAAVMVNSFGFGGTNACAAIGAAPPRPVPRAPAPPAAPPLLLSAHSAEALRLLAQDWRPLAGDAAARRAQARHRDLRPHRLVVRDAAALDAWLAGEEGAAAAGIAGPGAGVAFAFSGNGAQWAGMGRAEMRASRAFRAAVEAADALLRPHLGWSVARALRAGASAEAVADTTRAQPLLYATQLGIVAALAEQGIRPTLVLGHSVGEVAAAQVAGLLSPAGAARLVAQRSRHQGPTRGRGRMAALGAPENEAAPLLAELGLELAAVNGPAALTVAGPADALERLAAEAKARRWGLVALDLDYAFHSALMDPVRDGLLAALRGLRSQAPRIPMLSSVTGGELGRAPAAYWWRNLREPVRFDLAAAAAFARRPALVIEIGPHPVLQGYLRANARAAGWEGAILPGLRRDPAPGDPFPAIADRCTALGADPRGGPLFAGDGAPPGIWRALPPLPMPGEPLAPPPSPERRALVDPAHDGPLLGFRHDDAGGEEWRRTLDTLEEPWLADHALESGAVLPAAAMAEMALEAAAHRHPQAAVLELRELLITQPLPLSAEAAREVRTRLDAAGAWVLESRRRLSGEGWARHATARLGALPALAAAPAAPLPGAWREGAALTEAAARRGLRYGPAFRPVTRWRAHGAVVEAELACPAAAPPDGAFLLHPARLDGALQSLLGLARDEGGFLPVRIGRLALRRGAAAPVHATLRLRAAGERELLADGALRDALGDAVAVLDGVELRRVPRPDEGAAVLFHAALHPAPLPPGWPGAAPVLDPALAPAFTPAAAEPPGEAALLVAAHQAAALAESGLEAADSPLAARLRPLAPPEGLPPSRDIWQQVAAEAPALAHELALLAEAAEAMPAALRGATPALRLSPEAATLRALAEALAAEAAALLAAWPRERPCRVLVAGAEEGPLLPALRRALAPLGAALSLVLAVLPGARPPAAPEGTELLDWDPAGAPPGDAALVLGLNLSARLGAGPALAARLRPAVAPGGALLLAEPAPGLFWEATEGLGWPAPRLLDAGGWEAALAGAGFAGPCVRPAATGLWPALLLGAAAPPGADLLAAAPGRRFAIWAAPGNPLATALGEALEAAGAQVAHLPPDPAPRQVAGAALVALPGPGPAVLAGFARMAAGLEGSAAALHLVATDAAHDPHAAAILAIGRVLANEAPRLKPRRHALEPALPPHEAARRLAAILLAPDGGEGEGLIRSAGRLVPRLATGLPARAPGGPQRLEAARPGRLDSLGWTPFTPGEPGPGQVRIRVEAAGLNFRDLLWAQNLLPEDALRPGFAGPGLGMEVAGVVEAAGEGAPCRPGARVFGVAPRALATHAVTAASALAPLPEGLAMEEAAALPVAFLTAIHALEGLARVGEGDRVLIHGGAGALGLAALQVALAAGARVAVTAGTPQRRAFLRLAGAALALDSRDLGFADALRLAWGDAGEGCVDICLNTLSGEAMERSLGLMAPFGRFLELGKRDFAEGGRVALRPLRRNVAWFAVDLDELARARPAEAARHMAALGRRLAAGELLPLPVRGHAADEVEDAFRRLQAGGHIGKLVIRPPAATPAAPCWAPEGTAVVVGGTAGFGLEAACALAGLGVRHLALISRRGPATPGLPAALARLRALGAQARAFAADATDRAALDAALRQVRAAMPPIAHVVHAGAVFADAIALRMEPGPTAAVWDAKVTAAGHLDALTADDPLRAFILFSSATVPVGAPGQGAYVAANAGLEAIARRRHAQGRPALAVQWGPVADAGALAADGGAALTHRLGAEAMPAAEALALLPRLLDAAEPVAAVARMDWAAARSTLPCLAEAAFRPLAGAGEAEAGEDIAALLAEGPEAALAALRRGIAHEVARILRLPAGAVGPAQPLQRLGLDSLGGLELRTALERRFGVTLPLEGLGEGLTVDLLARRLLAGAATLREAAE